MGKKSKLRRQAAKKGHAAQVAALPYRFREKEIEFLVITSRRRKRLIVPKGWPMNGKSDYVAAAIEAHEEAGVKGEIAADPFGFFEYIKELDGDAIRISASVFPLRVRKLKSDWKERKERKRKWLTAEQAAVRLDDPGLGKLVERYAALLRLETYALS